MISSRFFWRNFLSYTAIIAFTTAIVSYVFTVRTEEISTDNSRRELREKLALVEASIYSFSNLPFRDYEKTFRPIAEAGRLRLTIIDLDGLVLFDSDYEASSLDNHRKRPELAKAIENGQGESTRFSVSSDQRMMYAAKRIQIAGDDELLLRLALPVETIKQRHLDIRYALLIGALAGVVLALCLAIFLARRITKPIAAMTRVAEAMSRGNYSARLRHLPKNDLGNLGSAINRLAEAVQNHNRDREKMEKIKREFSSNIGHELKTPLTSIKGYVETLQEGALDDREVSTRFLSIIRSNIDRIISLVTDLMNLATIESNEGLISLKPTDWRPIISEVIGRQEIALQRKNIAITTDLPETVGLVMGSRKAMTHILDNLVQNAVNYTKNDGAISVQLRQHENRVALLVEDDGIGISPQDQARIFERFYRVDEARSPDAGGTGLGLAIVKHLVIQIKGTIDVKSKLGIGTEFTVSLPKAD